MSLARPSGFAADVATVARRALRSLLREPEALIPKKATLEDGIRVLRITEERIRPLDSLREVELEHILRNLVEELGMKTGQVFMTLRVALTGSKVSPGLFETMAVLGKDRVLNRLENAIMVAKGMAHSPSS